MRFGLRFPRAPSAADGTSIQATRDEEARVCQAVGCGVVVSFVERISFYAEESVCSVEAYPRKLSASEERKCVGYVM